MAIAEEKQGKYSKSLISSDHLMKETKNGSRVHLSIYEGNDRILLPRAILAVDSLWPNDVNRHIFKLT